MKALHREIGAAEIQEAAEGVVWWNSLTEDERLAWCNLASLSLPHTHLVRPVDAYRAYLRDLRQVQRNY